MYSKPNMSAWSKTLSEAPKDKPILVRLPTWDCPAVMRHEVEGSENGWAFVEQLIAEYGWLEPDEVKDAEWAPLPE